MSTRGAILRYAAALSLLVLAAAQAVPGQSGLWTTHGPEGGSVYCVVPDPSHPSTLYAGTNQGVFVSNDAGASWRSAGAALSGLHVQTIAMDPTATSTLYAGTLTPDGVQSVGIFKSTDGGASWTDINIGLADPFTGFSPLDVETLAIDPRNPSTLYAGTRFSEIFKSTDGGANWQPRTSGGYSVSLEVPVFQFHPTDPTKVYAASSLGLLRSLDGGDTWSVFGNAPSLSTLIIHPTAPNTLYGGDPTGGGLFKSTDGGSHWSAANKGLPTIQGSGGSFLPLSTALLMDPGNPLVLYAASYGNGLFKSTDGASNWAAASTGMRDNYVVSLAFESQTTTLLAGTLGGGIYQSANAGGAWSLTSAGLGSSYIYSLAADPATGMLFAATFDGIVTSVDGAASWQRADSGLPVNLVAGLAIVPGSSSTVFAATMGGGLLRSRDAGASWSASASGLGDAYVASIAVDPSSLSTLYAGTGHPYDGSHSERLYKSTDGGSTWTQTSLDAKGFSVDSIAVNPATPSLVIASSHGTVGYFQSRDGGKTWSTITSNATCGGVNAVLFDPSGTTEFIAGTAGVCRSTDAGATWTVSTVAPLASAEALVMDPSNPSVLYAGASPAVAGGTGGVFRSTDGGATWQELGSNLPNTSVTRLLLDATGGTLYAGTHGGGVAQLAILKDRTGVHPPAAPSRRTKQLTPR